MLWAIAHQVPLSMGFFRQEYWNGLPFPSPGNLPNPGIESASPALQSDSLPPEPPGKPVLDTWRLFCSSVQFRSATQSCPALCDLMGCSMSGFPVHHQLPEPIQTHVHRISDAIQPFHPLSSLSPLALNLSQHQGCL